MQLSYSQIWTFTQCPKRFFYRFREKLPDAMYWQASFGTSVHNALYRFIQEIRGAELWDTLDAYHPAAQQGLFGFETVTEARAHRVERLIELLDLCWVSVGYESSAQMYEQKQEAIALLQTWYAQNHTTIEHIKAVELSFKLPLGDAVVCGRFDRIDQIDGQILVLDYKSGVKRTQEEVDNDMQLSIYALVLQKKLGIDRVDLALYFLRDNSIVQTSMSKVKTAQTEDLILRTTDRILMQDFAATPTTTTCQSCPYKGICTDATL